MNRQQARQVLNMKLQTRVNEAKCKALIDNKLLADMFSHEIQQMHYETVHKKLEMAYAAKKLSVAHNRFLVSALEQYSKAIKSNKSLLETLNKQLEEFVDKEKDLLELREETILGVKETMDVEINSILEDDYRSTPMEFDVDHTLPNAPNDEPGPKKALRFGNVIIKTIDEAEEEKEEKSKSENQQTVEDMDIENNDERSIQFLI